MYTFESEAKNDVCVSLFPRALVTEQSDVYWTPIWHHRSQSTNLKLRICVCAPQELPSVPLVLFPSFFLYYHPALGCQLVHERFAQHEILHVDRINQKEEIKVGFAPKWFALCAVCCNVTCLFYCPPSITHALSRTGNRIKTKEDWPTLYMLDTRSLISTHAYIQVAGKHGRLFLLQHMCMCVLCLCPLRRRYYQSTQQIN